MIIDLKLGYFITVVEDACAALSIEDHTRGLDGMRGFSRLVSCVVSWRYDFTLWSSCF